MIGAKCVGDDLLLELVKHLGEVAALLWRIFPLGERPDYEPDREHSIAGLAEAAGVAPLEMMYDLLLRDGGRSPRRLRCRFRRRGAIGRFPNPPCGHCAKYCDELSRLRSIGLAYAAGVRAAAHTYVARPMTSQMQISLLAASYRLPTPPIVRLV